MNIAQLKTRKGEPVAVAWKRLLRWVESLKIVPDDRLEVRHGKHGLIVRVRDSHMFHHPFRISAGQSEVRVSAGTVDDIVPEIEGRRIDNRTKTGEMEKDKEAPVLKIDGSKSGEDGTCYVSLRVKPGQTPDVPDAEPPEIVQTEKASGPKDGYGYQPLALLWMSEDRKTIDAAFQITHHNMRYAFQERRPSEKELKDNPAAVAIGRHLFFPR